jgi:hypothetical protein
MEVWHMVVVKWRTPIGRNYQYGVVKFTVLSLYENMSVYRFTNLLHVDCCEVLARFIREYNKPAHKQEWNEVSLHLQLFQVVLRTEKNLTNS